MKNLLYLLSLVLLCGACKKSDPEKDYQACIAAEEAYNAFVDSYDSETATEESKASFDKESEALFEKTKAVYADFFKKNINSVFAQNVFSKSRWTRRLNEEQLGAVVLKVKYVTFKKTDAYRNALDRVFRMQNTRSGHPYTNIVSKSPMGKPIELADYVGKRKYVVLNFWASWCPDCRKEMPELVEMYAAYKDKNFEIVGYSLDQNKDTWVKSIETLNIVWPQMSDCDFWDSQGAKLYAVQAIPLTILINPEGNIIERGLDIATLKKNLAGLLK